MENNQLDSISSVEDVMQESVHNRPGAIVVNMTEGSGLPTVTEGNTSDKEHSLFSGILEKFSVKHFDFGLTTILTTKETLNQRLLGFKINREARHDERFPTDIPLSDPIEPTRLASKIRSVLKAFPSPSSSTSKSPKDSKREHGNHQPSLSPHGVAQVEDARLVAMLQNERVMNGSRLGDDVRVSVWSVLESFEEELDENDVRGGDNEGGRSMEDDVRQASGIMMYSPLTPTNLSLVEIADSGVLDLEEQEEQIADTKSDTARVAGWMGMWPFSVRSTSVAPGPKVCVDTSRSPPIDASLPCSPSGRTARLNAQAKKRVWIPSSTQLSFQAIWWGYRIYLPPPIMDILGDKSMEYAKRTATITTALTWFFHNIPLSALPAAIRPAVLLLQTLIPYIGYIGSLISWSWGTIQSYDIGHGVILTATWLLPVALIPCTWEADDFPLPSLPSSPNQSLQSHGPSSFSLTHTLSPAQTMQSSTPKPEVPVQQLLSPAQSFVTAFTSSLQSPAPAPSIYFSLTPSPSSPVHLPNANPTTDVRSLSPTHLASSYPSPSSPVLLYPSQPLPPWVPPPPAPSLPTIPLPEVEEEEDT